MAIIPIILILILCWHSQKMSNIIYLKKIKKKKRKIEGNDQQDSSMKMENLVAN